MGKVKVLLFVALCSLPALVVGAGFDWVRTINDNEMLRGEFEQKRYVKALSRPLATSGTFVAAPEKGLRWTTLQPIESYQILGADGSIYDGDLGQSLDVNVTVVTSVLMDVVVGDIERLRQVFSVIVEHDESSTDTPAAVILTPLDDSMKTFVRSVELSWTADRQFVERVIMVDGNGNRTEVVFSDLRFATASSEQLGQWFPETPRD